MNCASVVSIARRSDPDIITAREVSLLLRVIRAHQDEAALRPIARKLRRAAALIPARPRRVRERSGLKIGKTFSKSGARRSRAPSERNAAISSRGAARSVRRV